MKFSGESLNMNRLFRRGEGEREERKKEEGKKEGGRRRGKEDRERDRREKRGNRNRSCTRSADHCLEYSGEMEARKNP